MHLLAIIVQKGYYNELWQHLFHAIRVQSVCNLSIYSIVVHAHVITLDIDGKCYIQRKYLNLCGGVDCSQQNELPL